MSDEKTVADEATDENLSKAFDQAVSETPAEEVKEAKEESTPQPETETPPEKPASEPEPEKEELDHKESSRLGRKVKGMENTLQQILARLEQPKPDKQEQIEVPDVITTPDDVERVLQAREQKSYQEKMQYEQKYLQQLNSFKGSDDDGLHDEVLTEMMKNHNVMHDIKNPFADARVNYAEAKAAVYAKKYNPAPKVAARENTSGKPPVQPAASATRTAPKAFVLPKLDAEAQSYVEYLRKKGMSDEDIAKELA